MAGLHHCGLLGQASASFSLQIFKRAALNNRTFTLLSESSVGYKTLTKDSHIAVQR